MSTRIEEKYVIFDTDMGPDDAWALQMILKAEKHLKNVKVLAITTVHGNTTVENAIKNTYRILDGLDRVDIPIYAGVNEPFIPEVKIGAKWNFGKNGFNDVEFWEPHYPSKINDLIQTKNAIEIIRELILKNPNKVSLICLGPLTNIALAIKMYPEIRDQIKDVFIMGGNCKGNGNTFFAAEFNFYMDPEAAHIVLNSINRPITIVPLECALEKCLEISLDWRFNILGKVDHKNVQLLNEIERIAFHDKQYYTPFDSLAVAIFLFPEKCIRSQIMQNATIELQGCHTRGQMVFDRNNSKHNVNIIEMVDEEEIKNLLQWTATA